MLNFSERLKSERIKRNLTQKEMAELLKIKRSTYSLYEGGKREPNIETLQNIASILDVNISWLLGYDDVRERKPLTILEASESDLFKILSNMDRAKIEMADLSDDKWNLYMKIMAHTISMTSQKALSSAKKKYSHLDDLQIQLLSSFDDLSYIGKREAIKRIIELRNIPEYMASKKK